MNFTALDTYLQPFKNIFQEDGVAEISINRPGEVWIENRGIMRCESIDILDLEHLKSLSRLIAQSTDQKISEETPLLSATLPNGYRIQIVFPPASEPGTVAMSIRKPSSMQLNLDMYEEFGAFNNTSTEVVIDENDIILAEYIEKKQIKEFLKLAIRCKKNIIISGGTSTGKTTFTNAALLEIPKEERLITCEDAREVNLANHQNKVHLIASKGSQGRAKVT
ncbi:MAG: type IV secretion system protein VirB11, partial [Sphingobacteriaceae bacterium]